MIKYLSVCSGIEAATVAWHDLGFAPVGFSEIEPFPSAVLTHHYPNVTNFGDMTKYKEWNINERLDLLVGGTPCQSFSVAGLRKGLDDPRGNLALTYCGILDQFKPKWFVWENVPGVLSSNGGRDFGSFLGAVAELGYGFAYRVLDAQYFGVAQRRRRVFVVGYLGDWRPATAVLFERESLRGDLGTGRKKREATTGSSAQCFEPRSPDGHARLIGDFAPTLNRMGGGQREPCVMTFDRQSSGEYGTAPVASTVSARDYKSAADLVAQEIKQPSHWDGDYPHPTLTQSAKGSGGVGASNQEIFSQRGAYLAPAMAFQETADPLTACFAKHHGASGGKDSTPRNHIMQSMQVRRLTPVECERLQGFPDNYTNIPWRKKDESPDGPRYKALGNSMAVPVMQWIGRRLEMVNDRL